jgi:hypothetical protein
MGLYSPLVPSPVAVWTASPQIRVGKGFGRACSPPRTQKSFFVMGGASKGDRASRGHFPPTSGANTHRTLIS